MKPMFGMLFGLVAFVASSGFAAPAPVKSIPVFKDPGAITIGKPVAGNQVEIWEEQGGFRKARNVTQATISPVLPDPANATGTAVLVVPGGGFMELEMDNEGYVVARQLADRGITAFVLKYRIRASSPDPAVAHSDMVSILSKSMMGPTKMGQPGSLLYDDQQTAATDASDALNYIRSHAAQLGIDPHRVGMVGFSAGAMMTIALSVAPSPAVRPDFAGIIYGPMYPQAVPSDAPPAFFALANDDVLFGSSSGLAASWQSAKRPFEIHQYEHGGHGFAGVVKGTTSDHWLEEFLWWLDSRGLLKKASSGK